MPDSEILTNLNDRFIGAFRAGSWALLRPILSPGFSYLDGATGRVWPLDQYISELEDNPQPTIEIDQIRVHVDGDTAVVSARTCSRPDTFNRYVDTYQRYDGEWLCLHACVWPLITSDARR